jgi:hypothetical protein
MKRLALGLAAALLLACGYVSFNRGVGKDEMILQQEIQAYYNETAAAFAAGNPQALADLFDPAIIKPMNHDQILAWAQKFFAEHSNGHFRVESLVFDKLGYLAAEVTLTYKVETADGKGDFGGVERDTLVKRRDHWYVSGWERISSNP